MDKTRLFFKGYMIEWLNTHVPDYADWIFTAIALVWIVLFSLAVHFVLHRLLLRWAGSQATASRWIWQRALFEYKLFNRLALTLQGIIIHIQAGLWLGKQPNLVLIIETTSSLWILVFGTLALFSLLDALQNIFLRKPTMRHFPLRGIMQSIKLISALLIGLLIISILMGKSILILQWLSPIFRFSPHSMQIFS